MTRSLAVDLGGTHIRFRLVAADARTAPVQVIAPGTGLGVSKSSLRQTAPPLRGGHRDSSWSSG